MDFTKVDSDGTQKIPAYSLPISQFVSEEFRQATIAHMAAIQTWPMAVPSMNAPKEEWDKFDAAADQFLFGPSAEAAERYYETEIEDTSIAGVHVAIVTPKAGIAPENEKRVLINVHGGGFTSGRGLVAAKSEAIPVAATARIRVVTIDYRMAPYATYPAASEDVEVVYRELLKTYRPDQIGIYGTSAGGTLTAQAIAWFRFKGLPRPGAAGIFAGPPMPLWLMGDSTAWGGVGIYQPGVGFSQPTGEGEATSAPATPFDYLAGASMDDPCVNPSASDEVLADFPPTLFITGTRSFDLSPTVVCHARFLKLGVESYLYVLEGGQHGAYNIGHGLTPEGLDTIAYIAKFFRTHLA